VTSALLRSPSGSVNILHTTGSWVVLPKCFASLIFKEHSVFLASSCGTTQEIRSVGKKIVGAASVALLVTFGLVSQSASPATAETNRRVCWQDEGGWAWKISKAAACGSHKRYTCGSFTEDILGKNGDICYEMKYNPWGNKQYADSLQVLTHKASWMEDA